MSPLTGLAPAAVAGSAVALHARPSASYGAKLDCTCALLQQAASLGAGPDAAAGAQVVQASSLGAEDMVISHLINALQLDIGIFVLDTGMLHAGREPDHLSIVKSDRQMMPRVA